MSREGQDKGYAEISDTGMENKRGNLFKKGDIKLDNCWPVPNQISCILLVKADLVRADWKPSMSGLYMFACVHN